MVPFSYTFYRGFYYLVKTFDNYIIIYYIADVLNNDFILTIHLLFVMTYDLCLLYFMHNII